MRHSIIKNTGRSYWVAALTLFLSSSAAWAATPEPLPEAQGRVILTVTGNIAVTNQSGPLGNHKADKAEFDMAMLSTLAQHEFSTETPWTEGKVHFRGVLLQDLLQRVGAKHHKVRAVALNEYYHEMDLSRPELDQLLLATHQNGKPMKIRDKGPIWLMLPLSELKQLNKKQYHELLIWQLKLLDVRYREHL
ncbi:molybdopterin-dependent oxidoreductase [Oceanisphaera pacifica]|uniref:Molybdopterin-dependent oxidoreductase n=1 Tax=Oceanisphaera pacifica TaxID=2818389 RepID=A0ABS3NDI5_9GAMM|nr:molybdopterin-dependent oxidoreductase [Oceanisphaera pacifica]MBO1518599.1 molybdopterin-dependent oxidoreductase [Oceanisphaera pacifica]